MFALLHLSRRLCSQALIAISSLLLLGHAAATPAVPVRFLLTFDDGPSLWSSEPTRQVLNQLASNPVLPGIKALFFVQTAHKAHGGNEAGKQLMHETCAAGHLLEVHSGSVRGHIPHTQLAPQELVETLASAKQAISVQCETPASLVRPPDWSYSDNTQAIYRDAGLGMLLTDLSANDGKIYGWIVSLRRRSHLHDELAYAAQVHARGDLPVVDGVAPIVVTFHDVNPYTASHMTEYLQILVEEAAAVGLTVDQEPFYRDTAQLQRAAQQRAAGKRFVCDEVSRSVSLTDRLRFGVTDLRRACF